MKERRIRFRVSYLTPYHLINSDTTDAEARQKIVDDICDSECQEPEEIKLKVTKHDSIEGW